MKLSRYFPILVSAFAFSAITVMSPYSEAACTTPSQTLKMATLAPEGTTLHKALLTMKERVKAGTEGCVDTQIYAGGTMGDERDAVRKIRVGQLQGGAFSGVGLGEIQPEIRVLELPFLFKSQAAIDSVYAQMRTYFEEKFRSKGFVLLGWAEVGLVQIFCNAKPITSKADLAGKKMWMWEGDPLAQAIYEAVKVVPVPLAITDVMTSLQTGLIDCAYAPALAAIAFQWHTKTKYVTKVDLVNGTGGLVLSQAAWDSLSEAYRKIVKQVIEDESKKLTAQTRIDNQQSIEAVKTAGLQVVELTPEAKTEIQGISKEVHAKLVGKLYPQELLDRITQMVAAAP